MQAWINRVWIIFGIIRLSGGGTSPRFRVYVRRSGVVTTRTRMTAIQTLHMMSAALVTKLNRLETGIPIESDDSTSVWRKNATSNRT